MSIRDPDARCGVCDARLSRVDADHESRCIRKADGWPPNKDHNGGPPMAGREAPHAP